MSHSANTHKSPKIEAMLAAMDLPPGFAPHYTGFFVCFNRQLYYEAHDVLEDIWLPIRGKPQARFYQGLIQMAGGFVHFQKNRLAPASRLFALALKNFEGYPAHHAGVDLDAIREVCRWHRQAVLDSDATINPWSPENPPQLELPSEKFR